MRYLALLLLLSSCQSWGWSDTADALLPDEFTMGSGSSSASLDGKLDTHWGYDSWDSTYAGDSESTYAALTWHLPSVKTDNGMSRETQRNLALLVDHMVKEEGIEAVPEDHEEEDAQATVGPLKMNLREGVSLPSKEVLLGLLGALLLAFLFIRYQKAQSSRRRW